jgi:putative ABC transport system permease protein
MPKYDAVARREQYYRRVLSGMRELPGVTDAAFISFLPMAMRGGIWPVSVNGVVQDRTDSHTASLRFVTPRFFAAMKIPMLAGRDVSEADTRDRSFAAVVSQSFARRYWPGETPIGRKFQFAFDERVVIGVVGDVRVRGLERSSEPQVYLPYGQVRDDRMTWYAPKDLVVRSSGNVGELLPSIRRIIREADPEQPVSDVRMLEDLVRADTAARSVQASVLGAFAALAALLAGIGIHGLLSFLVSTRMQEFGVRIALGAQSSDIAGLVLRESAGLACAGVVLGVAIAYAAARLMQSLLAGVAAGDAPTFAAAVAVATGMTLLGSAVPVIRAVRVEAASAIRSE